MQEYHGATFGMTQPQCNAWIHLLSEILLNLWLSETFDGHVHDKKIADEQPPLLPSGITLWQDTGFIGHSPGNVTVKMPTKKPKGKDLSESQKLENGKMSSFRIAVEHATGGVKRCRILRECFIPKLCHYSYGKTY
jgi:hypothetical protein